jgi:hypothetical protein
MIESRHTRVARLAQYNMIRKFHPSWWIVPISAGLIFVYCVFFKDDPQRASDSPQQNSRVLAGQPEGKPAGMSAGASWGESPFSATAKPEAVAAALAAMRYEKMKRLGYQTPAMYYQMSLGQLKALAKNNDPYAMLQLAEQYFSEYDYIKGDPDVDKSRKPREIAMENIEHAARVGHTHAAEVAAIQMVEQNDLIEAYAWHMFAQSFNDHSNDNLYKQDGTFAKMTPMEKAEARGRMDAINQRIYPLVP